jgi:hypothetical protein
VLKDFGPASMQGEENREEVEKNEQNNDVIRYFDLNCSLVG